MFPYIFAFLYSFIDMFVKKSTKKQLLFENIFPCQFIDLLIMC